MAGGAAKKAAVRQRGASRVWIGISIAVNAIYVIMRFGIRGSVPSRRELALLLLLEGLYVLSVMSILQSAKVGSSPELAIDLFVLSAVVQLLSLFWPAAWLLLWLIPAYGIWSFRGPLRAIAMQGSANAVAPQKKEDPELSEEEAIMAAKRKRRLEHKEKERARFALRR